MIHDHPDRRHTLPWRAMLSSTGALARPGAVRLRRRRRALGSLAVWAPLGLGAAPALAAPFAYVSNFGADTVSVIDTATNRVVATVPVGHLPYGVAAHPAGTFVYVANCSNDDYACLSDVSTAFPEVNGSVSVIETATNTVVTTVPVGVDPFGVAVHPAGTFVYVANFDGTVSVVDTVTHRVVATVPTDGGATGVAVHPAGTFVYATNFGGPGGRAVSVISTADHTVVATVHIGDREFPEGIAVCTQPGRFST